MTTHEERTLEWRKKKAAVWGDFGQEIEWTDELLVQAWEVLGDVPLNYDEDGSTILDPDDIERLDEDFYFQATLVAPKGTEKEDIWHWFDEMHSGGLAEIMYGPPKKQADKGYKIENALTVKASAEMMLHCSLYAYTEEPDDRLHQFFWPDAVLEGLDDYLDINKALRPERGPHLDKLKQVCELALQKGCALLILEQESVYAEGAK